MKEYLFLFTIGPVQSFIGNSRKMRDLYAGSFLLSHLILHIYNKLDTFKLDMEIEKIIPVVDANGTASAPNRIMLKASFSDEQCSKDASFVSKSLSELAKCMEAELRSEFKNIYDAIFNKFGIDPQKIGIIPKRFDIEPKKNNNDSVNSELLAQLNNFPEVYWAYEEFKDKSTFDKITTKLQAVKSLRPFVQTVEKAGRKCSLFPEYNAFFYKNKDGKKPKYIHSEAVEFVGGKKPFYALKEGEGLCALAFIKRMLYCISDDMFSACKYKYNKDIVSVAYMLLKDAFSDDSEGKELLRELLNKRNEGIEVAEAAEAIFDLQNGLDLSNDKSKEKYKEKYKEKDIVAVNTLYQYMKSKKIKINPYYAVVKFDGDGMGDLYRTCEVEEQTKLSSYIGKFASSVPEIMKEYNGMCIYAGGEDFLGFFPAAKAIPALMTLRKKFQEIVRHPKTNEELTFSAGVVFAHLMPPLKNVLSKTDEMEHMAKTKNKPNKDSFAISILKRSGTETSVCNRFGKDSDNLDLLCKILELIRSNVLSVSSVYNLLSVVDELSKQGENLSEEMLKPIIVSSICPPAGKNEKDVQNADHILALFKQYNCDIQSFTAALEIATFLGKEELSCIIE